MSADPRFQPGIDARRPAVRITLIYAVVGLLWIVFSDSIVSVIGVPADMVTHIGIIKGCAYVLITAALLYVLVRRGTAALQRSHRQVAENEQHLRRLIDTASEGIMTVEAKEGAQITFANERMARMLGYSVGELVGRSVLDFVDQDWRNVPQQQWNLRHGGACQYDLKLRHRNGQAVWVISSVNPVCDDTGRPTSYLGMLTDVTERLHAQRELDQFFSLSLELLCIAGFDGYLKKVNPTFEHVLGFSREELLTRPLIEFVHPDDVAVTQDQIRRLEAGEPAHHFEVRARRRDGTYRWLNVYAVPAPDERLIYAAARDITEHRQALEALAKSEAMLKSILAAAPIAIGTVTNRVFGLTNTHFAQMTGYSSGELTHKSARLLYESDGEFERVGRDKYAQMRRETVGTLETRWRRKDGSIIDVLLSSAAIDPANTGGEVVFTAMDITERKQSESALRQSESRFRSIFEQSPIGIATYDSDGRLLDANPACRELFGIKDFDQARGFRVFDDPHLPADAAVRLRSGESVQFESHYDFAQIRAKQMYTTTRTEPADFNVILTPLHAVSGAPPLGYMLLIQDFTARKRLEEQLRHAQKMEAIGQLAGGVSHDFNNILTAIFGNVELMRETLEQPDAGTRGLREGLDQIERSGQRAAALTRQLLSFSRHHAIKPEILDPRSILIDMEKMLRRLLPENVELQLDCDRDCWFVRADAGQIEQVVLNLVVNARDAMRQGGTLTIAVETRTLEPGLPDLPAGARPGPYVVLKVTDTGCGIDERTLPQIFDPFFTTKPLGQGTGLGLATVDAIVRRAEGHIHVSSTPGAGSVFEVLLPAITDQHMIATPRPDNAGRVGGHETILVCEDDVLVRELACHALTTAGYTVLSAADAQHAQQLVAACNGPIHLLVTDVVMPGMDGRQLAEHLLTSRPDLKVLFISGYAPDFVAQQGPLPTIADFLAKPFSSSTLLRYVRRVLDHAPATRSS